MNTTNRELRVFLSSTFRDMQAERDYLVRSVFPEIRTACRARHVQFTDIDLRWGLTREEAEQGKVLAICLDEIEKCRPYFIGFLGERYGWSPTDSDLTRKNELIARFPSVENSLLQHLSVTEMEIRHGVFDTSEMATHSFFYFRSIELSEQLMEKCRSPQSDYFESDKCCRSKLARLKKNIRNSGLPLLDGYTSIQEFGNRVKDDLLKVLEIRFPLEFAPTPLEIQRSSHEAYGESRCHAYVPDPEAIDALNIWVLNQKNLSPLVITGSSGLGKSSLIAYWTSQQKLSISQHLISHYVGSAGDSTPFHIIGRLIEEIRHIFSIEHPLPEDSDRILTQFSEWLARIPATEKLIIVLDGLNQIDVDHLAWLPIFWPANVRFVLTVTPGRLLDQCKERNWEIVEIRPLGITQRRRIVSSFLAHYRKALADDQVEMLVNARQAENPLYLRILLEELRVFGSFDDLNAYLHSLLQSKDPSELYQLLLERLEADVGRVLLSTMLRFIQASRKGLTEREIQDLTGIRRLELSRLLSVFEYHLSRKGGELNFFHDYLRQAVKSRYLKSVTSQRQAHLKLAEYFNGRAADDRTLEELPWQWFQARSPRHLKVCLIRREIFEGIYSKAPHELQIFWTGCSSKPGNAYRRAVKNWLFAANSPDDVASFAVKVTTFLAGNCADYPSATHIANWASAQIPETAMHAKCIIAQGSGFAYRMHGKFEKARRAYNIAALIADELPTLLSPTETVHLLTGIARLQRATGDKLELAVARYNQAMSLATKEQTFGVGMLAMIKAELAGVQKANGQFEAAIANYELAKSDLIKLHGGDYLELADILNSLGDLWEDRPPTTTVTLKIAEDCYRQAMLIREHRLGVDHPLTASSLNNLARIAHKHGASAEAIKLASRVLDIRRRCLPEKHPDIATSLNQLARIKGTLGKFEEAEADYLNAIDICISSFGEVHRRTFRNIQELSVLLLAANRPAEALVFQERGKKIRELAGSRGVKID